MTPAQVAAKTSLANITVNKYSATAGKKQLSFDEIKNILIAYKAALADFDKAFQLPPNSGCFDILEKLTSHSPKTMNGLNQVRLNTLSKNLQSSMTETALANFLNEDQEAKKIYIESANFILNTIKKYSAEEAKENLNNKPSDTATITTTSSLYSAPTPRREAPITTGLATDSNRRPFYITVP